MKITLRILCLLLFTSLQTTMLADLITQTQDVRYYKEFKGIKVYLVSDDAIGFYCENIGFLLINGKKTLDDNLKKPL